MVRLAFVYAVLLALIVCASSGVLGATAVRVQTTKISLESIVFQTDLETPLFGSYFYEPQSFHGDFEASKRALVEFLQERRRKMEELKKESQKELEKVREEHKQLMIVQTNLSREERGDTYSKWAVAMYANIGRQAFLKQGHLEKIAQWDKENFVLVKSISKEGKKVLYSLQIHKQSSPAVKKTIASIP